MVTESAETTMRPSDRGEQPGVHRQVSTFRRQNTSEAVLDISWADGFDASGNAVRFGLRETETELRTGGFDVDCEVARDLWRTGSFCFVEFTGTSEQHDDGRLLSPARRAQMMGGLRRPSQV